MSDDLERLRQRLTESLLRAEAAATQDDYRSWLKAARHWQRQVEAAVNVPVEPEPLTAQERAVHEAVRSKTPDLTLALSIVRGRAKACPWDTEEALVLLVLEHVVERGLRPEPTGTLTL